jgi:hypothetical protein
MSDERKKKTTGPPPQTVKVNKPWEEAVADALKKKRPEGGWPDSTPPKPNKKKPA